MPSHTVRVLCEARSQSRSVRDAATGEIPFFWRGSSVLMQLGLTDHGQHLLRAGVGTIIVEVKALSATSADDSLMRKEFAATACDATFVAADWAGGAKQLLAANFTLDEAAILPGTYRLIVRHIAPDESEMTHLSAELRVLDPQSGSEGIDAPPVAWSYLEALPVVRVDIDQTLTDPQKSRARTNIGAMADTPAAVQAALAAGPGGARDAIYADSYVDIRMYGATAGVGVSAGVRTANTAAIQSALDTGKNVLFPIGQWEINGRLFVKCSGQKIFGESPSRSVVRQTSADYGHFRFQANDVALFPENPPGGSLGMSHFVTFENLFLVSSVPNANAGIDHDMPDPETGLYPSGLTWLEDNLRIRDVWVEGYSLPGGRGIDLYSCAKIFIDRIYLKKCDIGAKSWGGSSNCQHWHGFSFNECRIGFWGEGISGSYIRVSDTSTGILSASVPAQEANFKLLDCQITIEGGQIEFNDAAASKNALFVDAEGGRIAIDMPRLHGVPPAHPMILARSVRTYSTGALAAQLKGASVYTHIHITNTRRGGHTAGTPLALSGGNTAFITSHNHGDFLSSAFSSNVHDNAFQRLAWSGGTKQVETATAAGTITAAGTVDVTVTSARLYGSPLTIPVTVALSDTASDWAAKVRTALADNYQISRVFTVGGTTTAIVLTETIFDANDATLNIAIANGTATGVTAAPTSTSTTAGVAGETVRITPFIWWSADSFPTPAANMEGMIFQVPGSSVTTHPGGDLRTLVRDASANPGTSTVYRWASLTRPNRRVLRVTNAAGHFGHPDLIIQANTSGAIATPLLATNSNSYRAALRGGISIKVKNASGFTNTVAPNGADTINGVGAALSLAAGESAELFTLGDGAWITL